MIAGARLGRDRRRELRDRSWQRALSRRAAPASPARPSEIRRCSRYTRSAREARRQLVLHHAELHRVRSRLEHGEDARAATRAQARRASLDRGRVVREIVVDGDAAHDAAHFHAALHACETRERFDRARRRHAAVPRGRDGGERVRTVVIAVSAQRTRPCARPCQIHVEAAVLAARARSSRRRASKRSTGVQHPRASTRASASSAPFATMSAARRQGAHEVMELRLDRGEIGKDVGVIELEVVEDRGARAGSAGTSSACRRTRCRTRRPRSRRKASRPCRADTPKFCGTPPIEESRAEPRGLEDPREHRVVVVLPWVPATASTHAPAARSPGAIAARRHTEARRSRISSMSGLPRVTTLPITNTSGRARSGRRPALDQLDALLGELVLIGG